jgi:hypothetical protein
MITCNLMGGLGNQLFQIFTTISHAMNLKVNFVFIDVDKLGGGQTIVRPTYWDNFLIKLKPFTSKLFPQMIIVKESGFRYNDLNLYKYKKDNICLYGYFQSQKYFSENFYSICRLIGLEQIKKSVLEKSGFTQYTLNETTSLHFRLGDYKKIQHFHPIMTYEYYKNSLDYFKIREKLKQNILYFCEEEDLEDVNETINKLKCDFPTLNFIRASNDLSDWEQMILMSCCRDNIIANSSFSWWGAHLNMNPHKIVCYPTVWFGDAAGHDTRDLCPMDWNKIHIK